VKWSQENHKKRKRGGKRERRKERIAKKKHHIGDFSNGKREGRPDKGERLLKGLHPGGLVPMRDSN